MLPNGLIIEMAPLCVPKINECPNTMEVMCHTCASCLQDCLRDHEHQRVLGTDAYGHLGRELTHQDMVRTCAVGTVAMLIASQYGTHHVHEHGNMSQCLRSSEGRSDLEQITIGAPHPPAKNINMGLGCVLLVSVCGYPCLSSDNWAQTLYVHKPWLFRAIISEEGLRT
jgi:hypothetical protein